MDNNQAPTLDELAGSTEQLPTLDELANGSNKPQGIWGGLKSLSDDYVKNGPYSGSLSDHLFSPVTAAGRILHAMGTGAVQGWESGESEEEQQLDQETREQQKNISKSASESWLRPSAAALAHFGLEMMNPTNLIKAGLAFGGAVGGFLGQTGAELLKSSSEDSYAINPIGKTVKGAAGQILNDLSFGAGMEVLPGGAHDTVSMNRLRADAVIGEGEEGYFGTQPPSPEDLAAREAAANEAGMRLGVNNKILPKIPEETGPAIPEMDDLARQIDPDTFKQWDRLQDVQENLRVTQKYLQGQLEAREGEIPETPGNKKVAANIDDVRTRLQTIDEQLRDLIPATSSAKNMVSELLHRESKEGDAYRDYVQAQALENALRLQELAPDVSDAYGHAKTLLTDPPKVKQPEGASTEAPQTETTRGVTKSTGEPGTGPGGPPKPSERQTGVETSQISATEIEKDLGAKYSGTGEFSKMSLTAEVDKAKALVDSDPERAVRVALGKEASPGIHLQAVMSAVKQLAYKTEDYELADRLSRSPVETQGSQLGQGLGMRRGIHTFDPVSILKEVNDAVKDSVKNADKKTENFVSSLEDRLDKFNQNWQELVRDIQCPE